MIIITANSTRITPDRFRQILNERPLILDGAMGTMIQNYNLSENEWRGSRFANHDINLQGNSEVLNLTRPEIISDIHRQYILAGADIITSNSLSAIRTWQNNYNLGDSASEMAREAVLIALRTAAELEPVVKRKIFVAASVGPTGVSMTQTAKENPEEVWKSLYNELFEAYEEQIAAVIEAGADILLIESVFDMLNLQSALEAMESIFKKTGITIPVIVSATTAGKDACLYSGEKPDDMVKTFKNHLAVVAVALNCSEGPESVVNPIRELARKTDYPLGCYPNAVCCNDDNNGQEKINPEEFAEKIRPLIQEGLLSFVGGCCGSDPRYIKLLTRLRDSYYPV